MLVDIYMNFHEDSLNGFQVIFCDFVTDGQTDGWTQMPKGKTMSPLPI